MEIRNNLISRTDINSISNSKKIHQFIKRQHQSYKQLFNIISKDESDGKFINTITNTKFDLDDQELLSLSDSTTKYYLEQCSIEPLKNNSLFIPLIEIVDTLSNPKLIFTVKDCIKYSNSKDYTNVTNISTLQIIMYNYLNVVRDVLDYPDKKKLTLVVSYRPNDKTAVFKFQVLDVLITKQGNLGISKLFYDQIKRNKNQNVYIEKYNDWYLSSSDNSEKRWIIDGIYVNEFINNEVATNPLVYESFASRYTKLPLVLSVNHYAESGYKKVSWPTKFDDDEYVEESDDSEKIQLFINHPKAKYYSILLNHLPPEYKTDIKLWKDFIKSCKHCVTYKLLFKEYSNSTNFADLFEDEWRSRDSIECIPMGYYHQICLKNKSFGDQLNKFLKDYIETLLYSYNFDILDKDAAEIIRFITYGKFYYSPNAAGDKWWYFVDENMDCSYGDLYKWKECKLLSVITMSYVHNQYLQLLEEIKNKIASMIDEKKDKKALSKIDSYIKKVGGATYTESGINRILPSLTKIYWLHRKMDSYLDVFGTINGIVDLQLTPDKVCSPEPVFITGYSKYFITKSVNARYRPFNKNDPACKVWLDLLRSTTPEKDAREFKWALYSTGLDSVARVIKTVQIIGDGANGKSAEMDNLLAVLGGDYAAKLTSNLLIGKSKPGAADNDLMQMKGKNIGFICETDQNDVIVASRLKTISECVKTGRKNYGDAENFESNCTVIVATNFALNIVDTDHGTFRRTAIYRQPFKFVSKPNPKFPEEKQANRMYETLARDNKEMADGLLACLIHKRIKFHHKYDSDIDRIPIPTIERYTNEYRVQQNTVASFLNVKIVKLVGYMKDGNIRDDFTEDEIIQYYMENNITYNNAISVDSVIEAYRTWYKTIGNLTKNDEVLKNEFRQSAIGKYFKDVEGGRSAELVGYRILETGKKKLKEEEYFM
jgi:phage/plasmid-associated DNA primase